jgi:4-amino-4-deoxy-L-arabinose transferase-like glycosyltransferase
MPARPGMTAPLLVTGLLILGLWAAHLPHLAQAGFAHYDEFHTLDRSTAFARTGDWFRVRSMNEPTFNKPPLQYWMSAALIEAGVAPQTAIHLPSAIFLPMALAVVALLAHAVAPGLPWAMPAAVLLHASSAEFWRYGLSAMLETGAGLFASLALAAAILALRAPRWWYVCAAAIALGALQKAPIGLVFVALWILGLSLTRRWHGLGWRALRAEPRFRSALRWSLAGVLAWPLFQSLFHGLPVFEHFFGDQMIGRFTPTAPVSEPRGLDELGALILGDEAVLRGIGMAAVLLLPWRTGRPEHWALAFIVAVFVSGMYLAGGHVTARYTLVVLPILSVAIACVALGLAPRPAAGLAIAAAVSALSQGPFKPADRLALGTDAEWADEIEVMQRVGAALRPEERLVVCTRNGPDRITPALASAFASDGRPFARLDRPRAVERDLEDGLLSGRLRGACADSNLELIEPVLRDIREVDRVGPFVLFTARGPD